jgi:hypothetical protein
MKKDDNWQQLDSEALRGGSCPRLIGGSAEPFNLVGTSFSLAQSFTRSLLRNSCWLLTALGANITRCRSKKKGRLRK